jgi:methionine aminotransferase
MAKHPLSIKSKLPGAKTTIFTQMSHLAKEVGAINLSQGFPNFPASEKLIDLAHFYMKEGYNQYAPMQGIYELREAISKNIEEHYDYRYSPADEITITSGATQAVYTVINTVISEGDEVIIIEPAFDIYRPTVMMNGGIPKYLKLKGDGFKIDWDEFPRLITSSTKLVIINTPHNPTSSVLTEEDMQQLIRFTQNTNILILSDEVYEHIIFDDIKHQSVSLYPELAERSFKIGSFGKTFHVTGWKTGYCAAPKMLMDEFRKIHQNVVFAGFHPAQKAIAEYMKDGDSIRELAPFYQKKRDYFLELMKDSKFEPLPSYGTYFQLFKYHGISDLPEEEYVLELTKDHGVASIPLSYFYHDGHDARLLRFCFAKTDETLQKAAEKLCKI